MLGFCSLIVLVAGCTSFAGLVSAEPIPPPPPPPPPFCRENEVRTFCYNNYCLKQFCVQEDVAPDCQFGRQCWPGCICKEGYLYAQNGTCVPAEKCPTPIICGENEFYSSCVNNPCFKSNCSQEFPSKDCKEHYAFDAVCVEGCICRYDYLRTDNGTCVPADECADTQNTEMPTPSSEENEILLDGPESVISRRKRNPDEDSKSESIICGENEMFSDCVNGGCFKTYCSEVGRAALCRDLIAGGCKPGCICKDGYLRTADGICVPINDCPKSEVCSKPHEYLEPCPSLCPSNDCSSYLYPSFAPCPPKPKLGDPDCYSACQCEEGYYKNYNQDCVPLEDCSKYCEGLNEILVAYPETCYQETCDGVNNTDDVEQNANKTCNSDCQCFPGYVRNKRGICVEKENCDKCNGPHEYYSCGPACDNECGRLDKMNQTNCPYEPSWGLCVRMCYCDEGYARDSNNICIPIADCPTQSSQDPVEIP